MVTLASTRKRYSASFSSFEEADDEYYASLTPQERVDILLDMIAAYRESLGETGERLERVYRVIELSER